MIQRVITIDGPAGSGKSTVARELAKRLRFVHLNSGALFRAVGLLALKQGIDLHDDGELSAVASGIRFSFRVTEHGDTEFLVDGEPGRSAELFSAEAGVVASKVAQLPRLREVLVAVQREIAAGHSVVVEGRDAGTVVFPEADHKIYLDALPEIRARRRLDELRTKEGLSDAEYPRILSEVMERDRRDSVRTFAAPGALVFDTSHLSIDDVVCRLAEYVGSADLE